MNWLDPTTLDAIYDAAVSADLVDRDTRAVLLQGVDDEVRLALPDHPRPDRQFRSDLQRLNQLPAQGPAPLRSWLEEAASLADGRASAAVFTAALARPDGPAAPTTEPAEPAEPPPTDPHRVAEAGGARSAAEVLRGIPWPVFAGAGIAVAGLIAALAIGGDDPSADAGPVDAGPVDAARDGGVALRPVAVKLKDATERRPALYRVAAGAVTVEDVDGPRTARAARGLAWTRGPITAGQFAVVTGSAPPPDADRPAGGLSVPQLRAYCDGLSRAEGRRPFYAEGGDGYRLPTDDEWLYPCLGGSGGPPAPTSWGLGPFGAAEAVADGAGRETAYRVRGGSGIGGIAGCTASWRPLGDAGAPTFRVVRPLDGDTERSPLGPRPVPR